MEVIKYISKLVLYISVFFAIIILLLTIIISIWINEYTYTDGISPIAKITTSNLTNNVNGSANFKITMLRENQKSAIEQLISPNSDGTNSTEEYIVNGRKYTMEVARIEWSDLFKSFGLDKAYKIILLSSNYEDTVESTKYPTDSFRLNGGSDEFLKYISQNTELANFFTKSIVFDKKTYEYLESPLIRTLK